MITQFLFTIFLMGLMLSKLLRDGYQPKTLNGYKIVQTEHYKEN
jgi:hypothetical protein